MYLPDPIERAEASIERWVEEHMINNMFKCGCGKWLDINKAETLSPDPYAIPVCPGCCEEYYKKRKNKNANS